MFKLTDITFHANAAFTEPSQLLEAQQTSLGYLDHLNEQVAPTILKHTSFNAVAWYHGIPCIFRKGRNGFFYLPLGSYRMVKKIKPAIILVQGLVFPVQVIVLRLLLGAGVKIVVQHHGEHPSRFLKKWFQQLADRCIDAYLFTAKENGNEWIAAGIIRHASNCFEALEASTFFERKNRQESMHKCGMTGRLNFLWVGRLNTNKDPLTVLAAFEKYVAIQPSARLYMIFQAEELLDEVKLFMQQSKQLEEHVSLVGKVSHADLPYWFSAAGFYLSGSRGEGSGYALIEAMSCGCIPVVTDIPSFRKITGNGQYGFLYEPGNPGQLLEALTGLHELNIEEKSVAVVNYFKASLSFPSIARDIYKVCLHLLGK